jgi:hypothetical protein
MAGLLGDMSVDVVCQTLGTGRRTGTLRISGAGLVGAVHFHAGEVVAVEYGDQKDLEAMTSILALREGAFSFRSSDAPVARRLQIGLQKLLLDAMPRPGA